MKNSKKKEEEKSIGSYFVIDNTGSYSVIYSDPSINARVQFIWKDELSIKDDQLEDEKEEELTKYK